MEAWTDFTKTTQISLHTTNTGPRGRLQACRGGLPSSKHISQGNAPISYYTTQKGSIYVKNTLYIIIKNISSHSISSL